MDIDNESDGQTIDDSVPVYEPLYPELERICSHPNCEKESPPGERICDDCTAVMHRDTPRVCEFCGDYLRRNPEE